MKLIGASRFTKTLLILISGFLFKVLISCCDCDSSFTYFDYNRIEIFSMNNSGGCLTNGTDTMKTDAIAFKIELIGDDSIQNIGYKPNFGFSQTLAFDCECVVPYQSRKQLKNISIFSLFKLTDNIVAGSEVTSLFLSTSTKSTNLCSNLYIPLDELIKEANNTTLYDQKTFTFYLFMNQSATADSAQFSIRIQFTDNSSITSSTSLITIDKSE